MGVLKFGVITVRLMLLSKSYRSHLFSDNARFLRIEGVLDFV